MARLVGILRRGVSSIRGRLGGGLYDRRSTACKQSVLHVSSMLKSRRFTVDMGLLCVVTSAVVVMYPAFLRPHHHHSNYLQLHTSPRRFLCKHAMR
jgi:hypothetical protein